MGDVPSKLLSRLSSATDILRRHDFIHIFSHYDADGIASASVLAKMLYRDGRDFTVTLFTTLGEDEMKVVESTTASCILMADMGVSFLDRFDALGKDAVVLDHHKAPGDSEKICYVNPHVFGMDGMTECCGSSLSLLLAVQMDEKNWDLSQIAFAGIVGDMQHRKGMVGINNFILKESVKRGFVEEIDGSLIPSGPLLKELYLTTDPYISGVSGNSEGTANLMEDAGLAKGAHSSELDESQQRKLSSLIALRLVSQGVGAKTMSDAVHVRYKLKDWNMDAEMFADILNACGRLGLGGIGVGMGLGDERCRVDAEKLNDEYRNKIVEAACDLDRTGLTKMNHIQWFDSSASGFTGVLCGIAMNYIGDINLPVIGINASEPTAKASVRGTHDQLDKGIDLSIMMNEAAKEAGGRGGGHRIASGASFPAESKNKFLEAADRIVGEQLISM